MTVSFRSFTYRLEPTAEQERQFVQFAGVCRLVWNLALEQRRDYWRQYNQAHKTHISFVSQCRELTDLRAQFDFIRDASQAAATQSLKDLEAAFRGFFAGRNGFPRMKKKGARASFAFKGRGISIERLNAKWSRVKLPKVGWVKFRDTRPVVGEIGKTTVTRTSLGWQISIGCEIETSAQGANGAVGIDRGVRIPLMLSDGTSYALPASLAAADAAAKLAQGLASRRKRGSARHAKQQRRVASLRARQARIRKDWAHRCTTDITRRYGTVVIEKLRTSNMTRSAKGTVEAPGKNVAQKTGLNRNILNVGWQRIETMLAYKAGRLIKVNPAYSSQTCASCGTVDSRSRKSQAAFDCVACGHRDNADRNAAVVILRRSPAGVEGSACGPVETRTGRAPKRSENLAAQAAGRG